MLHGTTLIKIKGALRRTTNATSLVAYKLGRTFRHFGHNGPQKKVVPPGRVTSTALTSGDPIPLLIPVPEVTIPVPQVTVPLPSKTIPVPPSTIQVPKTTIPLAGNTNVIPSLQVTPPAVPDVIFLLPDPPVPARWMTSPQTVSIPASTLPVPASSVTVPASSVTVPASSVKTTPPPLQFTPPRPPPLLTTTTTDVPPVTEESIHFIRWLNLPANTFESIWSIVEPNLDMKEFPLDAAVQDLPSGVPLIAQFTAYINSSRTQKEERTLVRSIASVKPISMTWGLLTSTTSLVTLEDTLETTPLTAYLYADIREFQFHETLSPRLTLRAAMQEDLSTSRGPTLLFYGTEAETQNLNRRRLLFEKPGGTPFYAVVTAVEAESSPSLAARQRVRRLTLDTELAYAEFPNVKPIITVYGNLVDATEGRREAAVPLGNGDSRLVFQTFKVPKAPVTYLISDGDTPPEVPELQVYVNDRAWQRVPSFFDRRPDEEIYIVREDADNISWVQFGDGQTGARLPSGVKNVVASYRTGTGAFGALKANTKVQAGARLDRLDKIQMPDVAAGGAQPEDAENAREAAPGKIQSLDRLVSLEDFESETLAIPGVTKAAAAWQLVDNIPEVVITVLMATGRSAEIVDVRATLGGLQQGSRPWSLSDHRAPGPAAVRRHQCHLRV